MVELTLTPVQQPAVTGRFVVSIIRDVSERKRLADVQGQLAEERAAHATAEATVQRLETIQAITGAALAHLTLEDLREELLLRIRDLLHVDAVTVTDRGIGIPVEQRAQIFERFHQAHAESYRSGMGLGLSISRRL